MSDENSSKKSKKKSRLFKRGSIFSEYILKCLVFLLIATTITVCAVFALITPAENLVHKIESAATETTDDIVINQDGDMVKYGDDMSYGDYAAILTCDKRGVNTNVYMGLNRTSARYGAGVSGSEAFFTQDGITVVSGYDETYLASLKYVKKGDTITVYTAERELTYKVKDAYYDASGINLGDFDNDLVVYSVFSDFSENAGKCYYVFADVTGEEAS